MTSIVSRDRTTVLIPGVVLAGGSSTRMGSPKALLPLGAGTFLSQVLTTLRASGLDDLVVVTGAHDAEIRQAVETLAMPGVRVVHNAQHADGQVASLRAALHVVDHPGIAAVLVTLVDHPLVKAETVRRLIDAWAQVRAPVVRPVFEGRHGHPVIFASEVFGALWAVPVDAGARAVVRALGNAVHDVPVDDPGVCADVDTPGDYARIARVET